MKTMGRGGDVIQESTTDKPITARPASSSSDFHDAVPGSPDRKRPVDKRPVDVITIAPIRHSAAEEQPLLESPLHRLNPGPRAGPSGSADPAGSHVARAAFWA
ncbi:hypothetical protein ACGFWI_23570 [Streptomyces sp. NPDC048434]|uniref:hypothetical protein n=1 Tax=Streptomyces sp. NPDC048434 TaxID=3365549 RepID=UPI00371F8799